MNALLRKDVAIVASYLVFTLCFTLTAAQPAFAQTQDQPIRTPSLF